MIKILKKNPGFASLLAIIVISAVVISITLTIGMKSVTEAKSTLYSNKANMAFQMADSCAEEGYFRLKQDNSYSGGVLNFGSESCNLSVSGSGADRTLTVSSTSDSSTWDITADVTFVTNNGGNATTLDLTNWL